MLFIRTIFLFLLAFGIVSNLSAQDLLLLNNGKLKGLKGEVVYLDHDEIWYQTENQRAKEDAYIKYRGLTPSEFEEKEKVRTATNAEKLAARKKAFEAEILEKLKTLSPEEFEKWKTSTLLKLKEAEAVAELKNKKRKKRRFVKRIQRTRVFSILKDDGKEVVVYNADTLGFFADGEAELDYGVVEMRMYIKGRQDGRKHGQHDFWIGLGSSVITSLAMTWFADAFYAPIFPGATVAFMTLFPVKLNPKLNIGVDKRLSAAYMDGYDRSASGRKAAAFTLGSLVGMSVGITGGLLTAPLIR